MSAPGALRDPLITAAINTVEGKVFDVPSHAAINEKNRRSISADDGHTARGGATADAGIKVDGNPPLYDKDKQSGDDSDSNVIIITGADAALHLLPLRDDFEPSLTFRSLFLATCLSAFQAVMYQIYSVSSGPRSCCWASTYCIG